MRNTLLILTVILSITACSSKKTVTDLETLPKDVVLKPEREKGDTADEEFVRDRENMRVMRASIDSLRDSRSCAEPEDWRISPLGSKPCGGPASYIAYHKDVEADIVPKIREFTVRQAAFNQKRNMFSDCMIEPQPSGIRCEAGKPVLLLNGAVTAD